LPDTGDVLLGNVPIDYSDLARLRRKMGYAVQGGGLFPHMTIFENVTLIAQLEGWDEKKIEGRFQYLFELMNLDPLFRDRYPNSLSGGQQQRASLCRAMMLNPPLMLLDEPFSALDPITRRGIHDEFRKLQQAESRTMILVTHDMAEAMKLADQLVILKEVTQHPSDEYVASLLTLQEGG
jgi:osmoprotectant transport system ATP-binding protein